VARSRVHGTSRKTFYVANARKIKKVSRVVQCHDQDVGH
jgi:hypothetical protein